MEKVFEIMDDIIYSKVTVRSKHQRSNLMDELKEIPK
jgi:hypothetical protein